MLKGWRIGAFPYILYTNEPHYGKRFSCLMAYASKHYRFPDKTAQMPGPLLAAYAVKAPFS